MIKLIIESRSLPSIITYKDLNCKTKTYPTDKLSDEIMYLKISCNYYDLVIFQKKTLATQRIQECKKP